jgi:hypothetical protein
VAEATSLRLCDLKSGEELFSTRFKFRVNLHGFSFDGKKLFISQYIEESNRTPFVVYDLVSNRWCQQVSIPTGQARLKVSKDGTRMCSLAKKHFEVWDLATFPDQRIEALVQRIYEMPDTISFDFPYLAINKAMMPLVANLPSKIRMNAESLVARLSQVLPRLTEMDSTVIKKTLEMTFRFPELREIIDSVDKAVKPENVEEKGALLSKVHKLIDDSSANEKLQSYCIEYFQNSETHWMSKLRDEARLNSLQLGTEIAYTPESFERVHEVMLQKIRLINPEYQEGTKRKAEVQPEGEERATKRPHREDKS